MRRIALPWADLIDGRSYVPPSGFRGLAKSAKHQPPICSTRQRASDGDRLAMEAMFSRYGMGHFGAPSSVVQPD